MKEKLNLLLLLCTKRKRESFTSQSLQSIKSIISPIFSVPPILVTLQESYGRGRQRMGRRR